MTVSLKIMIAQINPQRGVCDIAGNALRLAEIWADADRHGVDLVVTPEQSLTGYPLEDLAAQPDVLMASKAGLDYLVRISKHYQAGMIVGLPESRDGLIYNTAVLIEQGRILGIARKHDLPNEDVFDEKRIYASNDDIAPIMFRGMPLGILICEDLWHPEVAARLAAQGAAVLISPNASPWHIGKHRLRIDKVLKPRVAETGLPVLYVNQVGGIDELLFDGHSLGLNADGGIAYTAKGFCESFDSITLSFDHGKAVLTGGVIHPFQDDQQILWQALVMGTRDYVHKNKFTRVHLGNSGGVDSAVVAAIAVDALGAENVGLYKLPSAYTGEDSNDDADETTRLLGVAGDEINIWPIYETVLQSLQGHLASERDDVTHANLQARIRGLLLMALSNRNDSLLLSTGNKTELTVGFATLYGDMNGAFNPLKGVDKMTVYKLAEWRNHHLPDHVLGPRGPVIAAHTVAKKAKAELGPGNNFDEDVLPPYPILTEINRRYIEQNQSVAQIRSETGFDEAYITDAIRRTDWSEFKRRQACPGIKVTSRDFGKGYRVPITRPNAIAMLADMEKLTAAGDEFVELARE